MCPETQLPFVSHRKVLWSTKPYFHFTEKTSYIICGAQCKKNIQVPLLKTSSEFQGSSSRILSQAQRFSKCRFLCTSIPRKLAFTLAVCWLVLSPQTSLLLSDFCAGLNSALIQTNEDNGTELIKKSPQALCDLIPQRSPSTGGGLI